MTDHVAELSRSVLNAAMTPRERYRAAIAAVETAQKEVHQPTLSVSGLKLSCNGSGRYGVDWDGNGCWLSDADCRAIRDWLIEQFPIEATKPVDRCRACNAEMPGEGAKCPRCGRMNYFGPNSLAPASAGGIPPPIGAAHAAPVVCPTTTRAGGGESPLTPPAPSPCEERFDPTYRRCRGGCGGMTTAHTGYCSKCYLEAALGARP